jgi:hypothetical protein
LAFSIADDRHIKFLIKKLIACSLVTLLRSVWTLFEAGLSALPHDWLTCSLTPASLTVDFGDRRIWQLIGDGQTGALSLRDEEGHAHSPHKFIRAATSPPFVQRALLHSLITRLAGSAGFCPVADRCGAFSLSRSLDAHLLPELLQLEALAFSFSPSCLLTISDRLLVVLGGPGAAISTVAIGALPFAPLSLATAIASAKTALILMSLASLLSSQSVPQTISCDRITFPHDPFESVCFKPRPSFWAFHFTGRTRTVHFIGNYDWLRFLDFVIQLVYNASALVAMWRQADSAIEKNAVVSALTPCEPLGFTLSFAHDFCTRLSPLLVPVVDYGSHYGFVASSIPQLLFVFGRDVQLKRCLIHQTKNRQILNYFGAFLNSSFYALHRFYSVFCEGPRRGAWVINGLFDQRAFFVVHGKTHCANFVLKPSQIFQMIIPTIGQSSILHIPLEARVLARHIVRASPVIMRIHADDLETLRGEIDAFLDSRQALMDSGFVNFRLADEGLTCSYRRTAASLHLHCTLASDGCSVAVAGDGEMAAALRWLIPARAGEAGINHAQFIARLFDLEAKVLTVVLQFIGALGARRRIDWGASIQRSRVAAEEGIVLLQIVADALEPFAIRFRKRPGEAVMEIMASDERNNARKLKSVKDLMKWVETMARGEDAE